ncbi:hypothetical protein Tco_0363640 [Tanacetum coccineum]
MREPTMEKYMTKTRDGYGSGIARPKIDEKAQFELKGQFLKELRDNTFNGSDHEAFPMSLTGVASRWLRNEPSGLIITWTISTEPSDGPAAIQDQLNNLGREIKKVNKKVYVVQVGCAFINQRGHRSKLGDFKIGLLRAQVVENMDAYHDEGIGEVIVGEPFCKASYVEARRFDGMITIFNGNDNNGDALRKCILEGPYIPSTIVIQVMPATENSLAVPEHTTVKTILNISPANKAHFESEKEAIHMILTGIGDEIITHG